jgi:preprotein translocase subunit SecF
MAREHKFFEVIHPGANIDFVGTKKIWIGISIVLTLLTIAMLPINAYLIPGRGQMLNWSVEFKGGSEIETSFSKHVEPAEIRDALEGAGFHGVEAFRSYGAVGSKVENDYMIRMGSVAPVSDELAKKAEETLRAKKIGDASLVRFERSEGGDKVYLRYDRVVEVAAVTAAMKEAGLTPTQVQSFGRAEDHNYEAT